MSVTMRRSDQWLRLEASKCSFDILIIGGGATGLGAALDGALRGHSVLLVEQEDFGAGTSSRSTKLVHGGVRYLKQGRISLVRDSLRERGRLLQNAPGTVRKRGFVVPCRSVLDKTFYGMGLATYDLLAGRYGWGHSRLLSREETLKELPGLSENRLRGGVFYWDGQFNDARLALSLARTSIGAGAVIINHARVTGLIHDKERVVGASIESSFVDPSGEIGKRYDEVRAKVVISAVGVFSDELSKMNSETDSAKVALSQGAHIVLDRSFFPGESALMVPETDDGRVLFLIPWENRVLVGTTDTPVESPSSEPVPFREEVEYLLDYTGRYLTHKPKKTDIKSRFAGLRPLVKPSGQFASTSSVSRDHQIFVSSSGLISILGGKWTTYRKMAEDVIDKAQAIGALPVKRCTTAEFRLDEGADDPKFDKSDESKSPTVIVDPLLTEEMIRRMAQNEMAETVADVLARRSRILFLDAHAATQAAGTVARIMAEVKGWSFVEQERQRSNFQRLAMNYSEA